MRTYCSRSFTGLGTVSGNKGKQSMIYPPDPRHPLVTSGLDKVHILCTWTAQVNILQSSPMSSFAWMLHKELFQMQAQGFIRVSLWRSIVQLESKRSYERWWKHSSVPEQRDAEGLFLQLACLSRKAPNFRKSLAVDYTFQFFSHKPPCTSSAVFIMLPLVTWKKKSYLWIGRWLVFSLCSVSFTWQNTAVQMTSDHTQFTWRNRIKLGDGKPVSNLHSWLLWVADRIALISVGSVTPHQWEIRHTT